MRCVTALYSKGEIKSNTTIMKSNKKRTFKLIKRSMGVFVVLLVAILFLAYEVYFSAARVEKLITNTFNEMSNGSISLKVKKASLFTGFIIEDVVVKAGPDFHSKPILKLDKITVLYNVFGFFVGDIGIHELGVYNPHAFLYRSAGKWNYETLMKSSPEPTPEPEVDDTPGPGKIVLPFSIRAFIKFVIEDFTVTVESEGNKKSGFVAGAKNLNLRTFLITKQFSKIPLSVSEIISFTSRIDKFLINLDPQKKIDLYYKNFYSNTKTPLDLHWLVTADGANKRTDFFSRLIVGHQGIPVNYKGKHPLPLGFSIGYELDYYPHKDNVSLNHFSVYFKNDPWVKMRGSIDNASEPDKSKIDLKMIKSRIVLDKLYPFYKVLTGDKKMKFGGTISLPLTVSGMLKNLKVNGQVKLNNVFFNYPGTPARFSYLMLDYYVHANFRKNGNPILQARVDWKGSFNKARLGASIKYTPEQLIYVNAFIKGFNPRPFSRKQVDGNFDANVIVKGNKETNLHANISVDSKRFVYYYKRGRSGTNRLAFRLAANMKAKDMSFNSVKVNVSDLSLTMKNKSGQKTAWMKSKAGFSRIDKSYEGKYNLSQLSVNLRNLYPSLTDGIQELIYRASRRFAKDITFKSNTTASLKNGSINFTNNTYGKIEDLDVDDITFVAKAKMDKNHAVIPIVNLHGLNDALDVNLNGRLDRKMRQVPSDEDFNRKIKKLVWVPDLKFSFYFGKQQRERIFQNQTVQGEIKLLATLVDNIIDGKFNIDKFYYDNGSFTRINNVNLDFPFRHDRRLKKVLNLTAANKENIITQHQKEHDVNFTIDSFDMEIPMKPNQPFKVIYPGGPYKGFSAAMHYKDNVFYLPLVELYLLNGLVTVQNSIFNVGRGKRR